MSVEAEGSVWSISELRLFLGLKYIVLTRSRRVCRCVMNDESFSGRETHGHPNQLEHENLGRGQDGGTGSGWLRLVAAASSAPCTRVLPELCVAHLVPAGDVLAELALGTCTRTCARSLPSVHSELKRLLGGVPSLLQGLRSQGRRRAALRLRSSPHRHGAHWPGDPDWFLRPPDAVTAP